MVCKIVNFGNTVSPFGGYAKFWHFQAIGDGAVTFLGQTLGGRKGSIVICATFLGKQGLNSRKKRRLACISAAGQMCQPPVKKLSKWQRGLPQKINHSTRDLLKMENHQLHNRIFQVQVSKFD